MPKGPPHSTSPLSPSHVRFTSHLSLSSSPFSCLTQSIYSCTPPPTSPGCPNLAAHRAPAQPFHLAPSTAAWGHAATSALACVAASGAQMRGHLRPGARAVDEGPLRPRSPLPLSPREPTQSAPRSWRELAPRLARRHPWGTHVWPWRKLQPRPWEQGETAAGHGRSWRLAAEAGTSSSVGSEGMPPTPWREQQEMHGRWPMDNPGHGPSMTCFSPRYGGMRGGDERDRRGGERMVS